MSPFIAHLLNTMLPKNKGPSVAAKGICGTCGAALQQMHGVVYVALQAREKALSFLEICNNVLQVLRHKLS